MTGIGRLLVGDWLQERGAKVAARVRDDAAASESNGKTLAKDEGQDT